MSDYDELKPYSSLYKSDAVYHPIHYNSHPSGVECIEITRHMTFNLGNVMKYIWRAGLKDTLSDIEDLEKARWYLEDEITKRRRELHHGNQDSLGL